MWSPLLEGEECLESGREAIKEHTSLTTMNLSNKVTKAILFSYLVAGLVQIL